MSSNNTTVQFGDYLSAIKYSKRPLMDDDPLGEIEKKYPAFIANRLFSYHPDMIFEVAEMNRYHELPNKMQFDYYRLSVKKKKRFSKLAKEEKDTLADIKMIGEYYEVSYGKARDILAMLSVDDLDSIARALYRGGKEKYKSRHKK